MKLRRLLKWLSILAVLALLVNAVAFRHAYTMTHFTAGGEAPKAAEKLEDWEKFKVLVWGVDLPKPHSKAAPASLDSRCRKITISTNGVKLGAWVLQTAPSNPLVILFHGYWAEKSSLLPQAKAFRNLGCSMMLVDFRGSGDSPGDTTSVGYYEAQDVAAAVNYARANLGFNKLILYGSSMGAAAILRAVAAEGVRPDAIVVESVFDRLLTTVQHRFDIMGVPSWPAAQLLVFWGGVQLGFDGFSNNPAEYAARVECPILFLHGTDDRRARLTEARNVFEAVPGIKEFHEFSGLGHESGIGKKGREWDAVVSQFLERVRSPSGKG